MDHLVFTLLKKKITHAAMDMVTKGLNFKKIEAKNLNHQVSFRTSPRDSLIIEPLDNKYIAECESILQF